MPTQVVMPQLGESVVEGTVGRWLVEEGHAVKEYEPLCTVITDKVDTEIPSPASGVMLKIHVAEGETVAAGTLLAEIGEKGEETGAPGSPAKEAHVSASRGDFAAHPALSAPAATPVAQRVAAEHGIDLAQVPGTGPGGKVTREDVEAFLAATDEGTEESADGRSASRATGVGFISPAVGHLAAEMGVDLSQVVGTGSGGRITKKDVMAYVATPVPRHAEASERREPSDVPPWERPGSGDLFKPTEDMGKEGDRTSSSGAARHEPAADEQRAVPQTLASSDDTVLAPLSAIRKSIAQHMIVSKQTSPHVTTVMEADLTQVVRARERQKDEFERQGTRLTFTPFFIQAIVAGLKAIPEANSTFVDNSLLLHRRVHVGMAVAIAEGLIVPVIRDADEKSLLGLARAVNDLAERARTRRLTADEVRGGTFTLTNHGTAGSLLATPIINQPQAGILGVGAIQKRPIVISKGHPLLPDADDAIVIRPMVYLSFTFDHRILDGQGADGFLNAVKTFLETAGG